ncbi:AraC family transcriptional regulator [Mucilaginibacter sp. ZT4R22]|uniref:AraC family transcriptional regulator n=1 Tax=Mucilaginibacter pankratovii TaxID=2772110 RepID=A0ABR7WWT1_9SPHI|nr:helix-turn-helix domain-containing protein [Mucilaginibacter pankratovii]MBD1366760.1 AraC family transcriptional regulator [Mucilaginibacter pankratovii]
MREIKPGPALAQIVRLYRIIDFEFTHNNPIPPKAYTPRPEQCLQFFPTPTIIEYANKSKSIKPKNALLIGQHTIVNNRTVYKKFLSLQIVFQPGALYRLFGFSLNEITDQLIDAADIFGGAIEHINDQLYHAQDHLEMIRIAERFVAKLANGITNKALPIDLVAQQMLDASQPLDRYVSSAFLSHRQFDRQFIERMGIAPKEYLRVVRFDQAYRMKSRYPEMNWFNIAIACGYYDYQHLSKEYKAFTGYTPSVFFAMDSPERLLGTEEVY